MMRTVPSLSMSPLRLIWCLLFLMLCCTTAEAQSTYYEIVARHSGKALDVSEISYNNGAIVHQWDYVGGANQQWLLRPVAPGSEGGQWSSLFSLPVVAIHTHVLPNGKVLFWSRNHDEHSEHPHDMTDSVWLWDPAHPDALTNYFRKCCRNCSELQCRRFWQIAISMRSVDEAHCEPFQMATF